MESPTLLNGIPGTLLQARAEPVLLPRPRRVRAALLRAGGQDGAAAAGLHGHRREETKSVILSSRGRFQNFFQMSNVEH